MIIIEARRHSETRPERRAHHSGARGSADQCEFRQIQTQAARLGSLVDDDVEPVIFHRRIKIFFDGWLEPMDFVNEKDIPFFQTGEKAGELASFFNYGSAGVFDVHTHRVGNDVGKGGLAQTRGSAQQNVFEHVPAFFGRLHHQFQPLAHFDLAGEFAERWGSQRNFEGGIWLRRFHGSN